MQGVAIDVRIWSKGSSLSIEHACSACVQIGGKVRFVNDAAKYYEAIVHKETRTGTQSLPRQEKIQGGTTAYIDERHQGEQVRNKMLAAD